MGPHLQQSAVVNAGGRALTDVARRPMPVSERPWCPKAIPPLPGRPKTREGDEEGEEEENEEE